MKGGHHRNGTEMKLTDQSKYFPISLELSKFYDIFVTNTAYQ